MHVICDVRPQTIHPCDEPQREAPQVHNVTREGKNGTAFSFSCKAGLECEFDAQLVLRLEFFNVPHLGSSNGHGELLRQSWRVQEAGDDLLA